MNGKRNAAIGVATLSLFLGACVGSRIHRTAGEAIDDTTLTARVKAGLIADPVAEGHHVDVAVYRGVVQLNGFVESSAERAAAVKVARDVAGVKDVKDNLRIETRGTSVGEVIDDSWITSKVKLALVADPVTKARQIDVITNNGVVQLGGFVDSEAAKAQATKVATGVEHVKSVDNRLAVKQ